jgi:phosphatidylinositol glycan class O
MHACFKKAVIIIIDALRFDFVEFQSTTATGTTELPYQNKLRTIKHLLDTKPMNSRLYKFTADPPTTTMQRLKGLTTGSLPTFVDAGANFASAAIVEDNIIDQMVKTGKRVVFAGDDTWMGLFPSQFSRSFPYPSLNVKDLHTVDNGVIAHVGREMQSPEADEWDVLIGHLLGVDHCGHTFGPYHPAMAQKLSQMDEFLQCVSSSDSE